MNRQYYDEENNLNRNNTGNQNYHQQASSQEQSPNFFTNPQEAIAKELMSRAEEKLTKGWLDRFKCNFE